MPFIIPVIVAIGGAIGAVWGFTVLGVTVGQMFIMALVSYAISALTAQKPRNISQRQASVLEMKLGESPRAAIFGRACTGGTLMNVWNDGAENEFETLVIDIADHECDAIEGYYVNDRYYELTSQGAQSHADFDDNGPMLWIETRLGAPGQTLPSILTTHGVPADEVDAADTYTGLTFAVARYKVSNKVWAAGRPRFRWVVRGLKCYDPRLDDTIEGGEGDHRWNDPTTREWTENARICHANFVWGVWNYAGDTPQLMVGPGKSFEEAPPESVIADANACDEAVPLKAGGTEPRYRVGGVIAADDRWIDVEDDFAIAMGGDLVERDGTIGIDVGVAKSVSFTFDDGDLLSGQPLDYKAKVGRADLINTVIARYISPQHLWEPIAAPIRRSLTDIAADGEPREAPVDLLLVTSGTQAQRIAEIRRRKARLQPQGIVPLGAEHMLVEDGDWGTWTSERRFKGAPATFAVHGVTHDDEGRVRLILKQTAASVFSWDEDVDELDATSPEYLPSGDLPPATLSGFAAAAVSVTTDDKEIPAVAVAWTPPEDASIYAVLIEWRRAGDTEVFRLIDTSPLDGKATIFAGLIGSATYEARATPRTAPRREETPTDWVEVEVGALHIADPGEPGADGSDGLNAATVFLYQRAASAPSAPGSTLTYTFATGVLSGTLGSWTQSAPAHDGNPLYVTTAAAVGVNATDAIAAGEWATTRVMAENGLDGLTQVIRYKRSWAPPSTPTGSDPSGWPKAPEAGASDYPETLWFVTGTEDSDAALVGAWSAPQRTAPNWPRGPYSGATTYYLGNDVTRNGGTYRCIVESVSGQAPSGDANDTAYWVVVAAPGAPGAPGTPPSAFSAVIDLTSSSIGVNLRTIANAEGYTGDTDATITFRVPNGVVITGLAGAPNGGIGIDTGVWPTDDHDITIDLVVQNGGDVFGGGGKGSNGANNTAAAAGGLGGDALYSRLSHTVTVDSGGELRGGGGGGGGGGARVNATLEFDRVGGGGGGGFPNGPNGVKGVATLDGVTTGANDGANGTSSGGGAGGSGESASGGFAGGAGGAGGGAAAAGTTGTEGSGTGSGWAARAGGAGGAAGYAIRKNGHTVTVTNNGTITGTQA